MRSGCVGVQSKERLAVAARTLISKPTLKSQEVILSLISVGKMTTPVLCYWDIRGVSTITYLY